MYIITGLGRCGTSILTRYLKEVGFDTGYNCHWHDEARAGFELSTFYCITDWLYTEFTKKGLPIDLNAKFKGEYWGGLTYKEALNKVDDDEERMGKVEIVKDPRITWHPDLIESIYEARPDSKLIICHREIDDIYYSRNVSLSERYNDPKPRKKIEEYKIDFADFMTRVLKIKIPYSILFFPDFLKDYDILYNDLNGIGLEYDYDDGYEIWDNLVDRNLLK